MKNRNTMVKMFLSYILLAIPMVLIGFLVTNAMTAGMRERMDEDIDKEILQIEQKLNSQLIDYKDRSVKIATIEQLSPDKFSVRGEAARTGIEYLGNIKMMNSFLDDILLCYNGEIFTSAGYSRPSTFFSMTLGCEDSVTGLGNRILKEPQETVVYLPSPEGGYLLFHYPVKNRRAAAIGEADFVDSVNFCAGASKFYEMLDAIIDRTGFTIKITYENEWQTENVYLCGSTDTPFQEISMEDYTQLMEQTDWLERDVNLELWNIHMKVGYDAQQVYESVIFWQRINMLFVCILLFCSVLASWSISRKQYAKVYRLRESLRTIFPERTDPLPVRGKGDFEYMQTVVSFIAQETGRLMQSVDNDRELMKQQEAMLVFYKSLKEQAGKEAVKAPEKRKEGASGQALGKPAAGVSADCPGEERKKVDFTRVVEYIGQNFQRYDFSLEEVAEFAGVSAAYMSRLFKEKIGCKYIEYLTACRMEQAKRLLIESDMSIKDIAEAVGYVNVPGFRNKFKSYYGINASEIRKKYKNGSTEELEEPLV